MYGIQDNINGTLDPYLHYVLSVQSDSMIVSLVLAAIDFHMSGRRRWVIAMLVLAGLGRSEAWPILGLYSLFGLIYGVLGIGPIALFVGLSARSLRFSGTAESAAH